jgi:hypothetical protein
MIWKTEEKCSRLFFASSSPWSHLLLTNKQTKTNKPRAKGIASPSKTTITITSLLLLLTHRQPPLLPIRVFLILFCVLLLYFSASVNKIVAFPETTLTRSPPNHLPKVCAAQVC